MSQNISPILSTAQLQDVYIRKNFDNLIAYFQAQNQLLNFKFFEQVFSGAKTNFLLAHGLGFKPADLIVTQITGAGSCTFNVGLFDSTNVNITTSAACRVRFFVGSYWNNTPLANAAKTDVMTFQAAIAAASTSSTTAYKAPTQTILTTPGTSTYNPPAGALYLVVEMVGAGGGGAGSGTTTTGGTGGTGGATKFGNSLLVANGGLGGTPVDSGQGGAGGTYSLGGMSGVSFVGAQGGTAPLSATTSFISGGQGASSYFGGSGAPGINNNSNPGVANSGAGGSGAANDGSTTFAGNGGGSGSYLRVTFSGANLVSSFACAVGAGGLAGAVGSGAGAVAGSPGAHGQIIITVYYQ